MTFYIRRGTALHITDAANLQIEHALAPANYTIRMTPTGEWYLDVVSDFELPAKLYGNTTKHARRILTSFTARDTSTGVLLTGTKGSGKSLLAKTLSVQCRELGIPTLIIGAPYRGEKFNAFIQSIDQPLVVLFDEFEKVYNSEQQEDMLTLLDGMYPTKKLFVLTCNNRYRIDNHMKNRPGRIFYSLDFSGLTESEIIGYCEDQLDNPEHLTGVVKFSKLFGEFNFDMLKALVEEMNRFKEPAGEAYKMLNTQPGSDADTQARFSVSLYAPSGAPLRVTHPTTWQGVPFSDVENDEIEVRFFPTDETAALAGIKNKDKVKRTTRALAEIISRGEDEEGEPINQERASKLNRTPFVASQFYPDMSLNGAHAFRNGDGFVVVFTPVKPAVRDYGYMF